MLKYLILLIAVAAVWAVISLFPGTFLKKRDYTPKEKLADRLLPQEFEMLREVSYDIGNADVLRKYQKWLKDHGDNKRASFIGKYAKFTETMKAADAPAAKKFDQEWLNLLGVPLLYGLSSDRLGQYKEVINQVALPALQIEWLESSDSAIPVGGTKLGGTPDLPADFVWPKGKDCYGLYNRSLPIEEYAGFVCQINLADFKNRSIEPRIKTEGLLSIFCYHNFENDELIGIKLYHFPDPSVLTRTTPTIEFDSGNRLIEAVQTIRFTENIHLPELSSPFAGPYPKDNIKFENYLDKQRNSFFFCGYFEERRTSDNTPDTTMQNLFTFRNYLEIDITIQLPAKDLIQGVFDNAFVVDENYDP